jgi:hypothetical protein
MLAAAGIALLLATQAVATPAGACSMPPASWRLTGTAVAKCSAAPSSRWSWRGDPVAVPTSQPWRAAPHEARRPDVGGPLTEPR